MYHSPDFFPGYLTIFTDLSSDKKRNSRIMILAVSTVQISVLELYANQCIFN